MNTEGLGENPLTAFAQAPYPRSRHGRRHPLDAVLALSVCAMLSGACSLYAIAQWGRMQSAETLRELGFSRDRTPAVSTLHNVFSKMDADAFELSLGGWIETQMGAEDVAIDGKALRGIHGEQLPGVRPCGGIHSRWKSGSGSKRGDCSEKRWTGKRESELSLANGLLDGISVAGRVVIGDALYTVRGV